MTIRRRCSPASSDHRSLFSSRSFTAKGAGDAEENRSFTAKDAGDAEENKSFTAKDAKDASPGRGGRR